MTGRVAKRETGGHWKYFRVVFLWYLIIENKMVTISRSAFRSASAAISESVAFNGDWTKITKRTTLGDTVK